MASLSLNEFCYVLRVIELFRKNDIRFFLHFIFEAVPNIVYFLSLDTDQLTKWAQKITAT